MRHYAWYILLLLPCLITAENTQNSAASTSETAEQAVTENDTVADAPAIGIDTAADMIAADNVPTEEGSLKEKEKTVMTKAIRRIRNRNSKNKNKQVHKAPAAVIEVLKNRLNASPCQVPQIVVPATCAPAMDISPCATNTCPNPV